MRRRDTIRAYVRRCQERCQIYRQSLLVRQVATRAEVEAAWPGSPENPDKTLWGWIRCYGTLRVLVARLDPGRSPGALLGADAAARQQLVLDALADQPELVTLSGNDGTGAPARVMVYPKSDLALREIHHRNLVLATITDDAEMLQREGTAADVELLIRASEEQSYLQRLIVWIATTPGPGLPFPEGERAPTLPEAVAALSPVDFYVVAAAFLRVNVTRLAALESARSSAKRPDWPVFFAGVAGELGMSTAALMRDHSLASVLAAAAERARAHEEAMAQAKQEADRARPPAAARSRPPIVKAATARGAAPARGGS